MLEQWFKDKEKAVADWAGRERRRSEELVETERDESNLKFREEKCCPSFSLEWCLRQ